MLYNWSLPHNDYFEFNKKLFKVRMENLNVTNFYFFKLNKINVHLLFLLFSCSSFFIISFFLVVRQIFFQGWSRRCVVHIHLTHGKLNIHTLEFISTIPFTFTLMFEKSKKVDSCRWLTCALTLLFWSVHYHQLTHCLNFEMVFSLAPPVINVF